MKTTIMFTLLLLSIISCSQATKTLEDEAKTNSKTHEHVTESTPGFVYFETTIDITNASKDGIYIDDYVVHIDYDKLEELDGKKVKISGNVSIVNGLDKEYDKSGNEIIMQGRSGDTKHIVMPVVEVVKN